MGSYLLRLEAVNLDHFIFDTSELSTMRGGSQILSEEIKTLIQGMKPLSTGASSVLAEFECAGPEEAEGKRKQILDTMAKHKELRYATVVVDVIPRSDDFRKDVETVLARNRFRQFQQPSFAVEHHAGTAVCDWDGVRTAKRTIRKGSDVYRVSQSVYVRNQSGRTEKRQLIQQAAERNAVSLAPRFNYTDESPESESPLAEIKPSSQLGDLALNAPSAYKSLNNKMAVIVLDGNDFGKTQDTFCTDEESQQKFDKLLQTKQQQVMDGLMQLAHADQSRWMNGEILRLEVMMLAGDEIRLVVPAWCGWTALDKIFKALAQPNGHHLNLTYKAGIVFCNHHAPIQRMLNLADKLSRIAKDQTPEAERNQNIFAYEVLESFDIPPDDLSSFKNTAASRVLLGADMRDTGELVQRVRKAVPRNKTHRIVQLVAQGKNDEASGLIKKELRDLTAEDRIAIETRSVLKGDANWLHFLELTDYALN